MLTPSPRTRRDRRRGIAAVELAAVAPFLFFLMALALDYARLFYFSQTLNNCARNGAYFASDYPGIYSYSTANDAALQDAGNLSPSPMITVKYASSKDGPYTSTTPITNGFVEVTASWTFHSVTNFPAIPKTINLSRSCRMRMAPIVPSF